jgi:hypothetical protein
MRRCVRARKIFSGTRILFNYGEGVREPKLTDKFYSLTYNLPAIAQQLHVGPLAAPNQEPMKAAWRRPSLASG